jgi:hypothetical protein
MQLKVSNTLDITSGETDSKSGQAALKYYESSMSAALSQNKPESLAGIDLSGINPASAVSGNKIQADDLDDGEEEAKRTTAAPVQNNEVNLLDLGSSP